MAIGYQNMYHLCIISFLIKVNWDIMKASMPPEADYRGQLRIQEALTKYIGQLDAI